MEGDYLGQIESGYGAAFAGVILGQYLIWLRAREKNILPHALSRLMSD